MAAYVAPTQDQPAPTTAFDYTKHMHILASLLIHAAEDARTLRASNEHFHTNRPNMDLFPETLEDAIAEAVRETAFAITWADVDQMEHVLGALGEALRRRGESEIA